MRILVTNDDGINADGLALAEQIAAVIAGPEGEVWVTAPESEQSGVSHAISYNMPVRVARLGPRRFSVSGTPADCVILGIHEVMKNHAPDLVISGVNRGHNVGEDTVYSGTVGGAIEGAIQGVRAIALSQFYSAREGAPTDTWAAARTHGEAAVRAVLRAPWLGDMFYNVNFPAHDAPDVKGMRFTQQGRRARGGFRPIRRDSPGGKPYYWIAHQIDNTSAERDSDCALGMQGWVTMTPMRIDLTARDALEAAHTATP